MNPTKARRNATGGRNLAGPRYSGTRDKRHRSDSLLDISIDAAIENCRAIYGGYNGFSEARRAALADFVFNVGPGTAQKFRNTNKAIVRGDWEAAANGLQNSLWFKQVGNRGPKIVEMIRNG